MQSLSDGVELFGIGHKLSYTRLPCLRICPLRTKYLVCTDWESKKIFLLSVGCVCTQVVDDPVVISEYRHFERLASSIDWIFSPQGKNTTELPTLILKRPGIYGVRNGCGAYHPWLLPAHFMKSRTRSCKRCSCSSSSLSARMVPWSSKSRLKLVPMLVAPFRSRLIGSLQSSGLELPVLAIHE